MQRKDFSRFACGLAVVALLSACGGTDTPATAPTLSGTAATGLPIVGGDIHVACAGGAAISQPKLTDASGHWSVTLSGQTLPCAVQVTAGNIGSATGAANSTSYHSIAMSVGTVNITPLTDLVVANMAGKDPATWFTSPTLATLKATDIDTALGKIKTAWGLSAALGTQNPITSSFTATTTDPLDKALEALAKARVAAGVANHADLLPYVTSVTITTPNGFNFASQYAALSTSGSNATTSCATGETAMTFATTAATSPYTNGQQVCMTATTSTLAIAAKSLTNPTPNTAVSAPFSAYSFADGANTYEVIFNNGSLYEINLSVSNTFNGQFTPSTGTGTGTGTAGTSNLTVSVSVSGVASAAINVANVPKPTSNSEFCGAIQNDATFTSIGANAGGTLTINSCSFSGNVGNISATLNLTTPISMTVPYAVTYTYN